MKEAARKIPGSLIILAGILELIVGIGEKTFSTILIGIGFGMIGCLYFFEKRK